MAILLKQGGKTTAYKTVAAAHKGLLKLADGLTAEKREQAELFFEAGRYSLDTPFTLSAKEHPALASLDRHRRASGALFACSHSRNSSKKQRHLYISA